MANILRSQLYTFSNIFEAKENLVLIWKYILLITSNLVLDIYHLKLQELSSLFYCFLFQMQIRVPLTCKDYFSHLYHAKMYHFWEKFKIILMKNRKKIVLL